MVSRAPKIKKYQVVYDAILSRIQDGTYERGQRLPTETELQDVFDVSRITITRALNDLARDGWVERLPGAGSFVSKKPPAPASNRLFIFMSQDGPGIVDPIFNAMSEACYRKGNIASMVRMQHIQDRDHFFSPDTLRQNCLEACRIQLAQNPAGVFFVPLEIPEEYALINRDIVESFVSASIPVVLIDRDVTRYPKRSNYDSVGLDNRMAAYTLTEHLIQLGHKKIGFIGRNVFCFTVEARISGYRAAMLDQGLEIEEDWIQLLEPFQDITQNSYAELYQEKPLDAYVCLNDHMAAFMIASFHHSKIRVPEDVAVVGIDDVDYAMLTSTPLTTMRQPCEQIGKTAVKLMENRIENPSEPASHVLISPELVVRESCGASNRMQMDGAGEATGEGHED